MVYPTFLLGSLESCVPLTLCPKFAGAGLTYRDVTLCAGVLSDGLALATLRTGDSGRDVVGMAIDGRVFWTYGPAALPVPPNFDKAGVGGVFKDVGDRGNDSSCEDGVLRLVALLTGRNIPAPSIDVEK